MHLSDKINRLWIALQCFKVCSTAAWIQELGIETLNSCADQTGIHQKEVLFLLHLLQDWAGVSSFCCGLAVRNGELLNAVLLAK